MNRAFAVAAVLAATAGVARADSLADSGDAMKVVPAPDPDSGFARFEITGTARERADLFYNLDLDRGLTPSGQPLFPVPDPKSQAFTADDFRLRTDMTARSRGGTMDFKVRLDVLDDGAIEDHSVEDASGRPSDANGTFRLRRAYTEILTPVGVVVAGRVGNQFGMGMVANDGDCLDCDGGDSADRLALVVPARGYYVALAADLSASRERVGLRPDSDLSVDPRNNPHAATLAIARYRSDQIRAIRRRDGRTTVDWSLAGAYVWQGTDVPAEYLSDVAQSDPATMYRGLSAVIGSAWLRIDHRNAHIEAEAGVIDGSIAQGSLIPGALYRRPIEMLQYGGAIESEFGDLVDGRVSAGFDTGLASGDPAPGFGAFPSLNNLSPQPGDLDGSQAHPPTDNRIDNFRFSPDYRIDQILFHEIIGTVTDAVYLRPHARVRLAQLSAGSIIATGAAITSWAMCPTSTPSGARFLGEEFDFGLGFRQHPDFKGFSLTLGYALFLPGQAFANPSAGLAAHPAQLVNAIAEYGF